jgi:hypothetical protein
MSAPVFTVFLLFSLKTLEEPNWPVTAYVSGLVLTVAWVGRQLRSSVAWKRRLVGICLGAASGLGVTLTVLMHRSDWAQPVLAMASGPVTAQRPLPLRRFDPTCRLRGWRVLAAEVDRVRDRLRREGTEPVLAGSGWTLPGELAFYCRGHPPVYSLGTALGDRRSQYDLWRPNPVWDGEQFAGRTVVFVGEITPAVRAAFRRVDGSQTVTCEVNRRPVARWTVTVCRGFRGFRDRPANGRW